MFRLKRYDAERLSQQGPFSEEIARIHRVPSLSEATFRFFSAFDDLAVLALLPLGIPGYSPASRFSGHPRAYTRVR